MVDSDFYHEGMRAFQDTFDGRRVADAIARHHLHNALLPEDRALIEHSCQFFIATAWGECVDCSVKAGPPGFVRVLDDNTIEYPEYDGNSMYRTLGNLKKNDHCGLLFIQTGEFARKLRIRGTATLLPFGGDRSVYRGTRVVVRIKCQFFPNCGRYLNDGPVDRGEEAPCWKGLPHLRNILPVDDPHRAGLLWADKKHDREG